jgi:hypothetical protein
MHALVQCVRPLWLGLEPWSACRRLRLSFCSALSSSRITVCIRRAVFMIHTPDVDSRPEPAGTLSTVKSRMTLPSLNPVNVACRRLHFPRIPSSARETSAQGGGGGTNRGWKTEGAVCIAVLLYPPLPTTAAALPSSVEDVQNMTKHRILMPFSGAHIHSESMQHVVPFQWAMCFRAVLPCAARS